MEGNEDGLVIDADEAQLNIDIDHIEDGGDYISADIYYGVHKPGKHWDTHEQLYGDAYSTPFDGNAVSIIRDPWGSEIVTVKYMGIQ